MLPEIANPLLPAMTVAIRITSHQHGRAMKYRMAADTARGCSAGSIAPIFHPMKTVKLGNLAASVVHTDN